MYKQAERTNQTAQYRTNDSQSQDTLQQQKKEDGIQDNRESTIAQAKMWSEIHQSRSTSSFQDNRPSTIAQTKMWNNIHQSNATTETTQLQSQSPTTEDQNEQTQLKSKTTQRQGIKTEANDATNPNTSKPNTLQGKFKGFFKSLQGKFKSPKTTQKKSDSSTPSNDNPLQAKSIESSTIHQLMQKEEESAQMKARHWQNPPMTEAPVQRMVEEEEDEKLLQAQFKGLSSTIQKMGKEEDEEILQGKFSQEPIQKQEAKPNNTGLPDNLKSGIENLSGYSMDDVKVHYNSSKPAQLQAHAYAQGTDIHIGPGQEKHLPHEAWHVVQQKQGRVKPTMQMKGGVNVNDDVGLEREADVMGDKITNNKFKTIQKRNKKFYLHKSLPIVQLLVIMPDPKIKTTAFFGKKSAINYERYVEDVKDKNPEDNKVVSVSKPYKLEFKKWLDGLKETYALEGINIKDSYGNLMKIDKFFNAKYQAWKTTEHYRNFEERMTNLEAGTGELISDGLLGKVGMTRDFKELQHILYPLKKKASKELKIDRQELEEWDNINQRNKNKEEDEEKEALPGVYYAKKMNLTREEWADRDKRYGTLDLSKGLFFRGGATYEDELTAFEEEVRSEKKGIADTMLDFEDDDGYDRNRYITRKMNEILLNTLLGYETRSTKSAQLITCIITTSETLRASFNPIAIVSALENPANKYTHLKEIFQKQVTFGRAFRKRPPTTVNKPDTDSEDDKNKAEWAEYNDYLEKARKYESYLAKMKDWLSNVGGAKASQIGLDRMENERKRMLINDKQIIERQKNELSNLLVAAHKYKEEIGDKDMKLLTAADKYIVKKIKKIIEKNTGGKLYKKNTFERYENGALGKRASAGD